MMDVLTNGYSIPTISSNSQKIFLGQEPSDQQKSISRLESWSLNKFNYHSTYPNISQITPNLNFSKKEELNLKQQISSRGKRFTDYSFADVVKKSKNLNFAEIHQWRRPEKVFGERNYVLFNEIMGKISNSQFGEYSIFHQCLSFITSNPDLVERILKYKAVNIRGVYSVWLNIYGFWKEILVDDKLPLVKGKGGKGMELLSGYKDEEMRNEIWPLIVEKAFVKAFKGKLRFKNDFKTVLKNLTGGVCKEFKLSKMLRRYKERYDDIKNLKKLENAIFSIIKKALNAGYIAGFVKKKSKNKIEILPIFQIIKSKISQKGNSRELYARIGWKVNRFDPGRSYKSPIDEEVQEVARSKYGDLQSISFAIENYDSLIILETSKNDKFISEMMKLDKANDEMYLKGVAKLVIEEDSKYALSVDGKFQSGILAQFTIGRVNKGKTKIEFYDYLINEGMSSSVSLELKKGEYFVLIKIFDKSHDLNSHQNQAVLTISGSSGPGIYIFDTLILRNYEFLAKEIWADFCLEKVNLGSRYSEKIPLDNFEVGKANQGIFQNESGREGNFTYQLFKLQNAIWFIKIKNHEEECLTFECLYPNAPDLLYIGDDGIVKQSAIVTLEPKGENCFMIKSIKKGSIDINIDHMQVIPFETLENQMNSLELRQRKLHNLVNEISCKEKKFPSGFGNAGYREEEVLVNCDLKDLANIQGILKEKFSSDAKWEMDSLTALSNFQMNSESMMKNDARALMQNHWRIQEKFNELLGKGYESQVTVDKKQEICAGIRHLLDTFELEIQGLMENQGEFNESIQLFSQHHSINRQSFGDIDWIKSKTQPHFLVEVKAEIQKLKRNEELIRKSKERLSKAVSHLRQKKYDIVQLKQAFGITRKSYEVLSSLLDDDLNRVIKHEKRLINMDQKRIVEGQLTFMDKFEKNLESLEKDNDNMIQIGETMMGSVEFEENRLMDFSDEIGSLGNCDYFKLEGNINTQLKKIDNFKNFLKEAENRCMEDEDDPRLKGRGSVLRESNLGHSRISNASVVIQNMLNDLNTPRGKNKDSWVGLEKLENTKYDLVFQEIVKNAKNFTRSFESFKMPDIIDTFGKTVLSNSGIQKMKYSLVMQKLEIFKAIILTRDTGNCDDLNTNQKLLIINQAFYSNQNSFPRYSKTSYFELSQAKRDIHFQDDLIRLRRQVFVQTSSFLGDKQVSADMVSTMAKELPKLVPSNRGFTNIEIASKKKYDFNFSEQNSNKKFFNRNSILERLRSLNANKEKEFVPVEIESPKKGIRRVTVVIGGPKEAERQAQTPKKAKEVRSQSLDRRKKQPEMTYPEPVDNKSKRKKLRHSNYVPMSREKSPERQSYNPYPLTKEIYVPSFLKKSEKLEDPENMSFTSDLSKHQKSIAEPIRPRRLFTEESKPANKSINESIQNGDEAMGRRNRQQKDRKRHIGLKKRAFSMPKSLMSKAPSNNLKGDLKPIFTQKAWGSNNQPQKTAKQPLQQQNKNIYKSEIIDQVNTPAKPNRGFANKSRTYDNYQPKRRAQSAQRKPKNDSKKSLFLRQSLYRKDQGPPIFNSSDGFFKKGYKKKPQVRQKNTPGQLKSSQSRLQGYKPYNTMNNFYANPKNFMKKSNSSRSNKPKNQLITSLSQIKDQNKAKPFNPKSLLSQVEGFKRRQNPLKREIKFKTSSDVSQMGGTGNNSRPKIFNRNFKKKVAYPGMNDGSKPKIVNRKMGARRMLFGKADDEEFKLW